MCGCTRRKWTSCAHPWHFAFQWKGHRYRFSLDKQIGREIKGKTDAETVAERLRTQIREGVFNAPTPKSEITVRELADEYTRRYVRVRKVEARAVAYEKALGRICGTIVPHPTRGPLALGMWPAADTSSPTRSSSSVRRG